MARVFDGTIHVHYSQAYFIAGPNLTPDIEECFFGQMNGICGAASPGFLCLVTGLHTGRVGFVVDVLNQPPPVGGQVEDSWEEIVEASFFVKPGLDDYLGLSEWGGMGLYKIPLSPGSYRVRYCARGMQLAHDPHHKPADGDVIDSYALIFWPAEPASDRIVKETTKIARYWHQQMPKKTKRTHIPPPQPPKPYRQK